MATAVALPSLDAEAVRRRELGSFLRSRRERIAPEQVGLRPSRRRRTPGLRREEVAQLAGVGITWYTWLEQGRDINPSPQVLDSIARTLLFDLHERAHLFTLAGATDPAAAQECETVAASVRLLLAQLDPFPALVVNGRTDILAYNGAWASGFPHLEALPFEQRNCLWLMFTDPHWRRSLPDWNEAAARLVAQYRAAMAEHVAEPAWKELVGRLQRRSGDFAELWARHDVQAPESRVKRFRHPQVGLLRLDYSYLWLGQRLGTRMVTYTPADAETARRLRELLAPLEQSA